MAQKLLFDKHFFVHRSSPGKRDNRNPRLVVHNHTITIWLIHKDIISNAFVKVILVIFHVL